MQSEDFLNQVRDHAGLAGRDEAARVSKAVLGILGQLQLNGELKDTAAQLPGDIDLMLQRTDEPEMFNAEEFTLRIQRRLQVSGEEADAAATAVLSTVRAALTDGQRLKLLNQLPNDFRRFATAK